MKLSNSRLKFSKKGGIESARMPGDSPICVGRLDDNSGREKKLPKNKKISKKMMLIEIKLLDRLVALFGSPAPPKVYVLGGET